MKQTKFANFHCSVPIITVSVICSFQVEFVEVLRNSFLNQDFEMCILKFGSQKTKVWILCDQSLDPGGDS